MYKASFLLLMLLLPATLSATDNVAIVEGFVAAYNRHDVDGMLEFVAPDVRWMSVTAHSMSTEVAGREQLGQSMREYFAGLSSTRSEVRTISRSGPFVHTVEQAFWKSGDVEKSQCSVAVYEITDGLVQNVWYFDGHACTDAD